MRGVVLAVFLAGFKGLSRGKSKSNLNCNYPCHNPEAIQGRPKEAWLSFCQLDGEGGGEVECVEDGDPPPSPPPTSPPCFSHCNTAEDHCEDCGMCFVLCPDHSGCNCDTEEEEIEERSCDICRCSSNVCHAWDIPY